MAGLIPAMLGLLAGAQDRHYTFVMVGQAKRDPAIHAGTFRPRAGGAFSPRLAHVQQVQAWTPGSRYARPRVTKVRRRSAGTPSAQISAYVSDQKRAALIAVQALTNTELSRGPQLLAGMIVDRLGLLGVAVRELSPGRIAGAVLLLAGAVLIRVH